MRATRGAMSVAVGRSDKRRLFLCVFVELLVLLVATSDARRNASIPIDTRLGQICAALPSWEDVFWLPHMGVCVTRHYVPAPGQNWTQWWLTLAVDDYDGQLPAIRKGPLLLLDDRDLEYFPYLFAPVSIKAFRNALLESTSYKICRNMDCSRNVESLVPVFASETGGDCVQYTANLERLYEFPCEAELFFAQLSYGKKQAMQFRMTLSAHRITGPLLAEFYGVSQQGCAMECMNDEDCVAFNYAAATKHCQLTIKADHLATADQDYDVFYGYAPK